MSAQPSADRQPDEPGHALTVRWSLVDAPDDVATRLQDYVAGTSHARFSAMAPLRFKTWRMRRGEWFEGCYVFESAAECSAFRESFTAEADGSPGSQIIGSSPILIEACEVVAVAEGGAGFLAAPRY